MIIVGILGSVLGWHIHRQRRDAAVAAEIERLEKERADISDAWSTGGGYYKIGYGTEGHREIVRRSKQIDDRLEKLTGVRPNRELPEPATPFVFHEVFQKPRGHRFVGREPSPTRPGEGTVLLLDDSHTGNVVRFSGLPYAVSPQNSPAADAQGHEE